MKFESGWSRGSIVQPIEHNRAALVRLHAATATYNFAERSASLLRDGSGKYRSCYVRSDAAIIRASRIDRDDPANRNKADRFRAATRATAPQTARWKSRLSLSVYSEGTWETQEEFLRLRMQPRSRYTPRIERLLSVLQVLLIIRERALTTFYLA